jgi:3-oxoacyl-[acyl-carrier-protein] synthase-1
MNELFVQSVGVLTAVGLNAPQTMGSLHTKVQMFSEVDAVGEDGEPVVGAPAPVRTDRANGARHLLGMAALALRECAGRVPGPAAPILLCAPEVGQTGQADVDSRGLLAALEAESGVAVDVPNSRVIPGGHAAIVPALREARALLASRRADVCYVGGVDSLLFPSRLERLIAQRRIKSGENSDGAVPGEAAAFLRISARPHANSLAVVSGLGNADEPPRPRANDPNTAGGLTRAMRQALSEAKARPADIGVLAHDVAGQRAAYRELALAKTRLRLTREQAFDSWGVATCVGDVGAATGPLTLAALAFFFHVGAIAAAGAMYVGAAEGGERVAVIIAPAGTHRERNRHG